tara:strand:+ start:1238 stop:2977 length:1740 start_codon:yes stop_codon:yes gene_type:complete
MDVLKRRMFQDGGMAYSPSVKSSNVLGRGSGFTSARPGIRRFERDANGNVLFTTYDTAGNIIQEELVDMRLSETGDPEEALAKQRQNKVATTMVDAAFATPVLKGVQLGTKALMQGSKIARGTKDVLAATAGLPAVAAKKGLEAAAPFKILPKFVENTRKGLPKKDFFGNVVKKDGKRVLETPKKLEQKSIFNPANFRDAKGKFAVPEGFKFKPLTTSLYAAPAYFGLKGKVDEIVTQEPEIAEIMDREVEDSIQAGIDGLGVTDTTGNVTTEGEGTTGDGTTGDGTTEDKGAETGVAAAQTTANSLSNFFSSDAFNDALRNIGGSLVKEGRFGAGLAAGSSAFADEQEAKRLLDQERMTELIKAGAEDAMEFGDISKVSEKGEEMNEFINNFEGANASIGLMNEVIALFEEAEGKGERVTGLRGRLSRAKDEISALIGFGHTPSTATKIKNYINVVKNKQIRNILNESGRTISDLDRRIVDEVFGNIDLFTSPDIALDKLRAAREQLKSSARQYQRNIRTGGTALALPQSGQVGQTYLSTYGDLINDILKIDIDKVDLADYNPKVGARVIKISLTDKT